MTTPSGDQYEISAAGYQAVVTECGAGLRVLDYDGRPLVAGYPEHEPASAGRGQLLVPWPNRIEDGRYAFADSDLQLPVNEVARNNAIHGLVRWSAWQLVEHSARSVSLRYRLLAQPGYPWTLDLQVRYDLTADGLRVSFTATNLSPSAAPYSEGAHPYLTVGDEGVDGSVDDWELTLPAATRLLTDDRMIPVGQAPVEDSDYDFRSPKPIGALTLDDGFTDLSRSAEGDAEVVLRNPATGASVQLWMDRAHDFVQVFTGDGLPAGARASLAVEPMTAPANAFRSGEGLVVLGPDGSPDDEHSSSWGIRAL